VGRDVVEWVFCFDYYSYFISRIRLSEADLSVSYLVVLVRFTFTIDEIRFFYHFFSINSTILCASLFAARLEAYLKSCCSELE